MDELTVTHQAEVLALKFALAFVVEVLPDDGRTSIRESLARLGAGADHSNFLQQAFSVEEEQSHRLQMALRQIVEMIDKVRSLTAAG